MGNQCSQPIEKARYDTMNREWKFFATEYRIETNLYLAEQSDTTPKQIPAAATGARKAEESKGH